MRGIEQGPFEPIAVIGLGALMPDAHDIDAFWQNILDAKVSIRPLPEGRWPGPSTILERRWARPAYGRLRMQKKERLFPTQNLTGVAGGNPGHTPQIDPCQLWAVTVSADAIEHAGLRR